MKLFILLIGTAMLLTTGCESDEHHHHGEAYGGAYGGEPYRSYGHGEYYPGPTQRPYDRSFP